MNYNNEYDPKKVNNGKFLLTDLIQGDEQVIDRNDFEDLSNSEIERALALITDNPNLNKDEKDDLLSNLWRINYKIKPPANINEFLTEDWIGPTAGNLYAHLKKDLTTFYAPDTYKRNLILAAPISYGKSTLTSLAVLYVLTNCALLRNPKNFFGKADTAALVGVLGSFTLGKAKQTLLSPFVNILQSSPKFRQVKMEQRVEVVQREELEDGSNRIVWTTASKMDGAIQFSGDLHLLLVSDPAALLGLNIIVGALSELSFFIEKGTSSEEIWRFYNDLKGRIYSRFDTNWWGRTIMDSSPNDMDKSPIDKYVFGGEASLDPRNMIVTSTHWDVFPEVHHRWYKDRTLTFPVFRGSNGKPPKILDNESERNDYLPDEIYDMPIDLETLARNDLIKTVKDYCGWPSGSQDKLITDYTIIDRAFDPQLRNLYTFINCPANKDPKRMIWDQIYKQFFIETDHNRYSFYRASQELRFISVDQSLSQDMTGITMCHPEMDLQGNMIIILDFTICIVPTIERINLESIYEFILDLDKLGNVKIAKITFDQFQSADTIQRLERAEYIVERFSVDTKMGPYLSLVSWMKNERVKLGKNIYFKNNMKSIQEVTSDAGNKKIDHSKGKVVMKDTADWNMSMMGVNAKDCSDSVCAAFHQCITSYIGVPRYQYIPMSEETAKDKKEVLEQTKKRVLEDLHKKYSLKVCNSKFSEI